MTRLVAPDRTAVGRIYRVQVVVIGADIDHAVRHRGSRNDRSSRLIAPEHAAVIHAQRIEMVVTRTDIDHAAQRER